MIFKKKPKNFEFKHSNPFVPELFPIRPANEYFGSIRKSMAKAANEHKDKTIAVGQIPRTAATHLCSGVRGILDNSWVLEIPFDLAVTTNGDGESARWETPVVVSDCEQVTFFEPQQWANHLQRFPKNTLKRLLKINTGWMVRCPKGYSLSFMPLDVLGENRFSVFTGPLIGSKNTNSLNIILYWHELNSETIIEAGTPICLLTPTQHKHFDIKKDFSVSVASREERERHNSISMGLYATWGAKRHQFFNKLFEED